MFLSEPKFSGNFASHEPDYGGGIGGFLREYNADSERWARGMTDLIGSSFGAGQFVDNFTGEMEARDLAYSRRITAIHDATGVQLQSPYEERYDHAIVKRDFDGDMVAYFNARPSKFQSQIDDLAAKFPEHRDLITGRGKSPEQQGLEISAAAEGRFEHALANPDLGLTSRIAGSIIGYLGASARDPIQLAATFAGGGVATGRTVVARILKVMATEAVINIGLETVLQVKAQNYRERAGLEYGLSDGLRNVGIAALFGSSLGGAVQGAREFSKAIAAETGRKLSEAGEQALERAFAEELLPGDAERLTGELSAFLDIELNPRDAETVRRGFEQDAIDNDFVDGVGSSFAINSDPDDAARLPLAHAALRYAEDPDNHLPPEVIEMQMADEIGNMPTFMNAEEYMLAYGLDAVDDPVASVVAHAEAKVVVAAKVEGGAVLSRLETKWLDLSDPATLVNRAINDGVRLHEELREMRVSVLSAEKELLKKYDVKEAWRLEDAPLTDAESHFMFHSEVPELSDINRFIDATEPVETLREAATELTYVIKDLPENPSSNPDNFEKAAEARLLFLGSEIERLGADPIKVVKEAARAIGGKYADQNDAAFMIEGFVKKIGEYIGTNDGASGLAAKSIGRADVERQAKTPALVFDPIGEQQLRPVDVPDFTPAEGDLNFGTIEPELKQSLDEARAAAGEIVAPETKDIGEMIGVSDEDGNVKMISARQALDDAESGVHMADVLEACNL